jgi:hypothetical protein
MRIGGNKTLGPLAYIGLVVLLLFIGDRAMAVGLGALVAHSEFRFSRLYDGRLRYDVLVVGNSRAVHSIFAPELSKGLCHSVFNVAYNGMSAEIEEAIVRDYLDHNDPPKAVLIEVSNVTGDNDLLNDIRLYAARSPRLEALLQRDTPATAFWMKISHLFAFNNELMLRAVYYLHHDDQDWILDSGMQMTPDIVAHLRPEGYGQPRLRETEAEALRRLIADLESRHIEVVLYVAPYHPAYLKLVPGYRVWQEELQREIGGEPKIIDLSRRLTSDAEFADLVHVNSEGGEIVTAMMAARLQRSFAPDPGGRCMPVEAERPAEPSDVVAR